MQPAEKNILVIGANSAIVQEMAKILALCGSKLFLAARNIEKLKVLKQDLEVRGAKQVELGYYDALDSQNVQVVTEAFDSLKKIDLVIIGHGIMFKQNQAVDDFQQVEESYKVNFLSYVYLLLELRKRMLHQGSGECVVISSVAGDRGRKSNYLYGSSKAGLSSFLSGLRNELNGKNIHVMTVLPGFVKSPMTADLKQGPLYAEPNVVAESILKSLTAKVDICYAPSFWRWIMLIIKIIPEKIFKRLSI
ncbi:MAG: SDR family NAD(P)-dependent oxidoreductase [Oligoflexales bacterium]|nr:SDR family NAD(P)-dependent oxidoreductase [Oligoflexales bacterium]